jgi:hypothetical protein
MPPSNAGQLAKDYTQNPVFERGSNLTLTWSSNYTVLILDFTQDIAGCVEGVTPCGLTSTLYGMNILLESITPNRLVLQETDVQRAENPTNPGFYEWTVEPAPYNISVSNVFYFVMYNRSTATTSSTFTSHYFNITDPTEASTSTTSSAAPLSSTSSSTSSSATINATVPTSSSAVDAMQPSSAGLSSGVKGGIIIGILALAILSVICALLFLRQRKMVRRPAASYQTHDGTAFETAEARLHEMPDDQRTRSYMQRNAVHEVPAQEKQRTFELDGNVAHMI